MIKHSPILDTLRLHSEKMPEKIAILMGDRQVSYHELYRSILKATRFMQVQGIEKGDKVILTAHKEVEFVYLYFASHLLGIQNVILDPTSNVERTHYILSLTQPKLVFGLEIEGYTAIQYHHIDFDSYATTEINVDELASTDVADIMFTTGTTGDPKGVLLTHENIYASATNINSFIKNTADDIEALGLPLCHSFGLGRLRCTLLQGATLILLGSFANVKLFFNVIEQYGVTGFGMVPAVWAYIKRFSGTRIGKYAEQMRYIEIGSAAMDIADKQLLMELFPHTRICMHYGLTEASRSLFMEFHENKNNLSTIGLPVIEDVQVRIINEEGRQCDMNEKGEICIAGNMVMKSYYLSADNENAYWGEYFRTGDWGYRGRDGKCYLVSRTKELINVGGKKVNPIEIEDAIIALGFLDCACIPVKDDVLGEVPKAFVVRGKSVIDLQQISALLIDKLETYKIPMYYEWIDTIPTTSSGKKQRLALL